MPSRRGLSCNPSRIDAGEAFPPIRLEGRQCRTRSGSAPGPGDRRPLGPPAPLPGPAHCPTHLRPVGSNDRRPGRRASRTVRQMRMFSSSVPPSIRVSAISTSSVLAAQCSGGLRRRVADRGIRVGAGGDQQPDDLRAVRVVAGPVGDHVQRRTQSGAAGRQPSTGPARDSRPGSRAAARHHPTGSPPPARRRLGFVRTSHAAPHVDAGDHPTRLGGGLGLSSREIAVDPSQHPTDHRAVVPTARDHPSPDATRGSPHLAPPRQVELLFSFGRSPLQEPGTTETDGHFRMRTQPHKITLIELRAAAPAGWRGNLNRLRSHTHITIIRPPHRPSYRRSARRAGTARCRGPAAGAVPGWAGRI